MNEAYKKYVTLIFTTALAATAFSAAGSADTLSNTELAGIPDIPVLTASDNIESIPELSVTVLPEEAPEVEIMAESLAKSEPRVSISFSFSQEEETAETADTPEATSDEAEDNDSTKETSDIPVVPDTTDTPETADTPDEPETKDEPLKETASPLDDAPEQQKRKRIGDVDLDGEITSYDALTALRIPLFGDGKPVECALSDVDGDGFITSADALEILRFSNGFSSELIDSEAITDENNVKWFTDKDGAVFAFAEDTKLSDGLFNIGGYVVGFGKDGELLTGAADLNGEEYVFTESGVLVNGWQDNAEGKSFFVNGKPLDGWFDAYDQTFLFVNNIAVTGWQTIGEKSCHFDDNGVAAKGVQTIDGDKYFFEDDGTFETGFIKKEFGTIYKDDYGFMKTGFYTIGDAHYHFADNGVMSTGSETIDGDSYLFGDDGVMITGWYKNGSSRSYLLKGKTATGALTIDGSDYFFEANGIIYTGLYTKEGVTYYKNENGVNQTGWQTIDGEKYYFLDDGKAADGFVTVDGTLYCFEDKGRMLKNTKVGLYTITEDGVCIKLTTVDASTIKYKADDIISQIGTDPTALCMYVHNHVSYYFINEQMVYDNPYNAEWGRIAAFAANKGYGACYHYSSFLDVLFQRAGYTSRIVVGTGYYPSLHSYNELLFDGQWLVYDALYGYCGYSIPYIQSLGFTINHLISYTY